MLLFQPIFVYNLNGYRQNNTLLIISHFLPRLPRMDIRIRYFVPTPHQTPTTERLGTFMRLRIRSKIALSHYCKSASS